MKKNCILFLLLAINTFAQDKFDKKTKPIVEEGKILYRSEMASWYGTDLFLEKYKDTEKIGGYFSYPENDVTKCIFVSKDETPKVIGTMTFDSSFDTNKADVNLNERILTNIESDYLSLRKATETLMSNDTLFKYYENTNLNIVPIIKDGKKKVYILTGPTKSGYVIFGNDYLIEFDKKNNVTLKKQLHKNIIPIEYKTEENGGTETMHTHLPETGEFITATDICTLMLYEKFAQWKNHMVISKEYVSIWNCETNDLFIMTTEAMKKISDHGTTKQ